MDNGRRIKAFLDRKFYDTEEAVITAALKALAREQMCKDAKVQPSPYTDEELETLARMQLEDPEAVGPNAVAEAKAYNEKRKRIPNGAH